MSRHMSLPVDDFYKALKKQTKTAKTPKKSAKKKGARKSTAVAKTNSEVPAKLTREERLEEIREDERQATGVQTTNFAEKLMTHCSAVSLSDQKKGNVHFLLSVMNSMQEMKPADATQAMLAVQMIGVHEASVRFLANATIEGQTPDGTNANVNRAARMMKLFVEQCEAMAKLKGQTGKQAVTVEHVTVNEGGQAVVGHVETGKNPGGEGGVNEPNKR